MCLLWILSSVTVISQNARIIKQVNNNISGLKTEGQKIDYLNNFIRTNYFKSKNLDGETALAIAEIAEEKANKIKDNYRIYTVNLNLYHIHNNLNHSFKASLYKTKASRQSTDIGTLHLQKIEKQNQELENNIKKLELNEKEIKDKDIAIKEKQNIISKTKEQLYLETLEKEKKETQLLAEQQLVRITQLELEEKKTAARIYSIIGLLLFLILSLLAYLYHNKRKSNQILYANNILIANEKKRSDDLLLNILPETVANELKVNGLVEPKSFEIATVMFTDFKDFTILSESLSPKELVHEIDYCFKQFDLIIHKYNLEKIKTIGDAYLCASGVPIPVDNHAHNMVKAALEIRDFMINLKAERNKNNQKSFDIRIGIHSGPLVAGVIGLKKFAYDIWGDTVNTASRLESSGQAGKVNVSGNTYQLVKEHFYFTHRGKIMAKSKGEIDMYFAENI